MCACYCISLNRHSRQIFRFSQAHEAVFGPIVQEKSWTDWLDMRTLQNCTRMHSVDGRVLGVDQVGNGYWHPLMMNRLRSIKLTTMI